MTPGYTLKSQEDKRELRRHLDAYRNKSYKETPLLDHFKDISEIVARSYNNDTF